VVKRKSADMYVGRPNNRISITLISDRHSLGFMFDEQNIVLDIRLNFNCVQMLLF